MKVFIVDSNLIFSAALNLERPIGKFIMTRAERQIKLYAPEYLKIEIERYFPKIVEIAKSTEEDVRISLNHLYNKIHFVSDAQIPFEFYHKALPLVRAIDLDDIVFVALNEYLNELLWTGDMELYKGLKAKGYTKVVKWKEVQELVDLE